MLVVAVLVLLATAAVAVEALSFGGDTGEGRRASGREAGGSWPPCQPAPGLPSASGVVPTPALSPRRGPVVSWIDDRLFVYGGLQIGDSPYCSYRLLNDAALIDVDDGRVDALSPPPFDEPLVFGQVASAPGSVIVVGVSCGLDAGELEKDEQTCEPGTYVGAAYDVRRDEWRRVALPESFVASPQGAVTSLGVTRDGRVVYRVEVASAVSEYWTLRPTDDGWTRLPDPANPSLDACLANDEIYAFTPKYLKDGSIVDLSASPRRLVPGEGFSAGGADGYVLPAFAALDLADGDAGVGVWRAGAQLDDVNLGPEYHYEVRCVDGSALLVDVINSLGNFRVYDATLDRWRTPAPAPAQVFVDRRLSTNDELLFLPYDGQSSFAYRPQDDAWRTFEPLPPALEGGIWNGQAIVGYFPAIVNGDAYAPGVWKYEPSS